MRWILFALALCGHPAIAEENLAPLEEVLVVGEHVWRSKEVESVIERSNEILGAYSVSLRVDQKAALQSRRGKLKEVLPARMYARWRALRNQYIGDDDQTEQLLPAAAALLLQARDEEVQRLHREAENLGEQGVVVRLRASGYAIEEPELLSR
jgi:hypothetical protein